MRFNFQFGNKKPNKNQIITISIILSILISSLSQCTGVSENGLWDLLDEIQRKFFPQGIINEFILQDNNKVNRRIIRDVDKAIQKIQKEYNHIIDEADKKYKPRYMDEKNDASLCYTEDCKKLAPPMRICSPVFDGIDCTFKENNK